MTRNAIVFTANTMHVAQANLMIDSLFDPERGNFQGDLWVISTHLSAQCQRYLDSRGIRYLINPLMSFQQWNYRTEIARSQPEFRDGSLNEDDAFLLYRNKRMSKLIICDWVEKFGQNYDGLALCDNDLYFQRDVNELFEKSAQVDSDVLWYWQEENKNLPGTNLWKKNFHYTRLHDTDGMDFGEHEINIGFVISSPNLMRHVFQRVNSLFSSCNIELFRDCKWHDQDLVRVIRAQDPQIFRLFEEGDVLHLCNGGQTLVSEYCPQEFYHKKTGEKPYIVHFAGGAWKPFQSISASYNVDHENYFFMEEQSERFDAIRSLTDFDPFDTESEYISAHNIATKETARKHWMTQTNGSDKKRMLFFTWLDTGSHQPLRETLSDFLSSEDFDLAVVDGNVKALDHSGLQFEDLPDLLSKVSSTVHDNYFGRSFGYKHDDVPEQAIGGAIAALVKEYGCSQRNARAVANAAYIYLNKTVSFYKPDVIVAWGTYLLCSRILKQICKEQGIPFLTMELGVLPQTLAFDCLGHMGESWVSQKSEDFNQLPLTQTDKEMAAQYLENARREKPSRNKKLKVSASARTQLDRIKASGKRVVVYIGSNCAFSGHVPYDEAAQKFHSPFYVDNDEVVRNLSQAFANDPDIQLIYKPHPITITRGLDLWTEYPGVTVLSDVNLGDCLDIADLAVVKVSQGNYESLLRDIPVLMLGRNQLNGSGAVYELSSKDDLRSDIFNALESGLTVEQKVAFQDHVARLLKYYLYGVSGKTLGRPQAQVTKDILSLLNSDAAKHLEVEQNALANYQKQKQTLSAQPKLSVVMPVYNGAQFLADCISSILAQTFSEFELLCVNNGSTDGSQEIIDYFARQDARVKPLYQTEANQRSARNLGVQEAKGEYLHFMDCDDLLVADAYTQLISAMKQTKADVVYFFFNELRSVPLSARPRHCEFRNYLPEQELFAMEEEHKHLFAQYPFPWAKFFRTDIVRKNELYFDLDCSNFDDNPHNLRALLSCQNIQVLNKALYRFRINQNSMTQSVNARATGMIDAVRLMNEIYNKFGRYEEFQSSYVPYKMHLLHFAWTRLPEELKQDYLAKVSSLFLQDDTEYFERDELASMFSYMSPEKVDFARSALNGEIPQPPLQAYNPEPRVETINKDWSKGKKLRKRTSRFFKKKAPGLVRSVHDLRDTLRLVKKRFKKSKQSL